VRLHCARYTKNLSAEATHIREVIKHLVNTPSVLVSTPITEICPSGPFSAPWCFLVSGMTQGATDCLVEHQMAATDATIIFTLPFEEPLPLYIRTLKGYLLDISSEESTIIADTVQATLVANPKISAFAHARLSVSDAGAATTAYRSIHVCGFKVRKSNTDLCSVWNIYCDCPPPMSFDVCLQWVKLIKNLMFPTEYHGIWTMCNLTDRGNNWQFLCWAVSQLITLQAYAPSLAFQAGLDLPMPLRTRATMQTTTLLHCHHPGAEGKAHNIIHRTNAHF
jgi:hypothetical protein